MNTKTSKVFAQHVLPGARAFGGIVTERTKPAMVNGSLMVRMTIDMGEGFLPRFESFDRLALDIIHVL